MKRVATFALVAALAACSRGTTAPQAPKGAVLTVVKALTSSINITRVSVAIDPGMSTPVDLTRDTLTGDFTGLLRATAGPAQTVTATAYAGAQQVGSGSAVVDILQNDTASVHLTLLDTTGAPPVPDHAPILTSVVVSKANPVVGEAVSVVATAVDPDKDPITYAWTQDCDPTVAAFVDPTAASTSWSANAPISCYLTVRASSKNLGDSVAVRVVVYPAGGNVGAVDVSATFVEQPVINSVSVGTSGPGGGGFYTTINRTDADATLHQVVHPGQVLNFQIDGPMGSDGGFSAGAYSLSDDCGGTVFQNYGPSFQWTAPTSNVVCVVTAKKTVQGLVDRFPVALFLSGCPDDMYEPNDTRQQAAYLPYNGYGPSATGLYASNDDWFQASLPSQPQTSTLKVILSTAAQLTVEIVDASGAVIGSGSNGASATIPAFTNVTGYVHVKPPAGGACGTKYDITVLQEVGTPTISISPQVATIAPNSMQWFNANVSGLPGMSSFTWSLSGPSCGSLDATGPTYGVNYRAPPTSASGCRLTATSAVDPSVSGSMSFDVAAPQLTVSPPSAVVPVNGTQTFTASGVGLPPSSGLYWYVNGTGCGSVMSDPANANNGKYYAPPSPASGCQVVASSMSGPMAFADVTVVSGGAGGPVSVSIMPSNFTLPVSGSAQFMAIVTGTADERVTWSVAEGASCGNVDTFSGTYWAPSAPATCHVVATSAYDPSQSATATITVAPPAITGTVSYSGPATGRVYIGWSWGSMPNTNPTGGWSLAAPGPFAIRTPSMGGGQAVVWAWIDTLGTGRYSAGADPFGYATVQVDWNNPVSDVGTIALLDPAPTTPPQLPNAPIVGPGDGFAFVQIGQPPKNQFGFELADHYTIYWSATPNPGPGNNLGSYTWKAGSNRAIVRGLTNGDLYFSTAAVVGGVESPPRATGAPVTIGPPTYAGRISGTVNVPAFSGSIIVTASAGNSWYPVMFDNPAPGPLAFSIPVPDGTYNVSVFEDVGSDGSLGPTNPQLFNPLTGVSVAGGANVNVSMVDLAAAIGPSASVTTNYYSEWSSLNLVFQVAADTDPVVPARALVFAGPGIGSPVDFGLSSVVTGNKLSFMGVVGLPPGVLPKVGDFYQVEVVYPDGTNKLVDAPVTGVVTDVPNPTSPQGTVPAIPTQFTWSAPATVPAGTYWYNPVVWPNNSGSIWSASFQGPATSATYGTGATNVPALSGGTQYWWWVSIRDAFGNSGWSNQVTFTTP
jgi:hypothetical protein